MLGTDSAGAVLPEAEADPPEAEAGLPGAEADAVLPEAEADPPEAEADLPDVQFNSKNGADQQVTQLVSLAKRRRLLAVQRVEEKADQAAADDMVALAGIAVLQGLPWFIDNESSCGQAAVGTVHNSHECITCGGFLGCNRCGSVVSTTQQSALHAECRRWCPIGAQRPLRRLRLGLLPWGSSWPNGKVGPHPHRLRPQPLATQ